MCCLLLLVGYPKFFRPAAPPNLGWDPPQIWDGCTHVVLKTGTDGKRGAVAITQKRANRRCNPGNLHMSQASNPVSVRSTRATADSSSSSSYSKTARPQRCILPRGRILHCAVEQLRFSDRWPRVRVIVRCTVDPRRLSERGCCSPWLCRMQGRLAFGFKR